MVKLFSLPFWWLIVSNKSPQSQLTVTAVINFVLEPVMWPRVRGNDIALLTSAISFSLETGARRAGPAGRLRASCVGTLTGKRGYSARVQELGVDVASHLPLGLETCPGGFH